MKKYMRNMQDGNFGFNELFAGLDTSSRKDEQGSTIQDRIQKIRRLEGKGSGGGRGGPNANPAPKRRKSDGKNSYTKDKAAWSQSTRT